MAATSAVLAPLRAARIAAHGLRTGFDSPEAVLERLTGVQAQDFGSARWAIGARVPGSVAADVDAAFERRAIVRSWPMRGTLHVIPRRFLRGILGLTRERMLRAATRRHQQLELEAADVVKAGAIAERMLAGGRSASREELLAAWEAEGIGTKAGRGYHVIWWLGLEAELVHGPVEGRGQRFVLADEWIPPEPGDLTGREAVLGALFAGYAAGHGPVTLRDFAWWTGLTRTDARAALAAAGERVEPWPPGQPGSRQGRPPASGSGPGTPVDPEPAFVTAAAVAALADHKPRGTAALAGFDEYFLGYADRDPVCPPEHAARVIPGGNGVFQPVLVDAGQVVGLWKRVGTKAKPAVELDFFERPSAARVARFAAPLAAHARFAGVELGDIRVRPEG